MTAKQLDRLADLADSYGSGEVRLTVWQNFIIPNVKTAYAATVAKSLKKLGFPCESSHLRNGFIACTGNKYCKFAASDTKGHAIAMMDYLDKRVKLDQPVNVHFTGCAHSCAQHFMGDIGLLGTKVKSESGEGYHITVGGGLVRTARSDGKSSAAWPLNLSAPRSKPCSKAISTNVKATNPSTPSATVTPSASFRRLSASEP
jgi:sulfite reductase beta subunit-like hemoprotein